ncbi:hypothetical protein HYALB_00005020 [Hymenoscyphus albidus]|uniref:Uncharacterized protein n=1 Tax=Hymenoscyphus albidus TaxID=595503 RepID=A0A9N9LGV5_9HELO|nr:hypothetical protein HYALB_00005020 [Hymenoscyphus albidus]
MPQINSTTEMATRVQLKGPSPTPSPDFEIATLEEQMPKQLEVKAQGLDEKEDERKIREIQPPPTPDPSVTDPSIPAGEYYSNAAADYSDVPELPTPDIPKQQRKHRRGGRKQRQTEQQAAQDFPDSQGPEDEENEEFERQEGRGNITLPKLKRRPTNMRRETGIRAFNLKRADSSGGRPFGVSLQKGDNDLEETKQTKSKSKTKTTTKPKNKAKRKVKCETCGRKSKREEEENWESQDSSDEESEEEKEVKKEPKEEEKPKAQKPMSIRLDLNLELEIFLRAKIKGDVTVTFL